MYTGILVNLAYSCFSWVKTELLKTPYRVKEGHRACDWQDFLCLFCSISNCPSATLGAFQALSWEGLGLLPKWWRMLCHRDTQRASQTLQVSDNLLKYLCFFPFLCSLSCIHSLCILQRFTVCCVCSVYGLLFWHLDVYFGLDTWYIIMLHILKVIIS